MPESATTIRLDPGLKQGLIKLSVLQSTTLNGLIARALREHLASQTMLLQQEFEASIRELQRLAVQDPGFERAIDRVVAAELSTDKDPGQGSLMFPDELSTTSLVRSLLNA
jgi:hypothetical protein